MSNNVNTQGNVKVPGRLKQTAIDAHGNLLPIAGASDIYDDTHEMTLAEFTAAQLQLNEEQAQLNEELRNATSVAPSRPGPYDDEFNGMEKVYLTKNVEEDIETGIAHNYLTQAMFQRDGEPIENAIFVINYDYELAEDITIPENSVLQFDGGSISGEHTITGSNTGIQAGLVKIFNTDITLDGTWNVAEAYPEWFGAKGDGTTDDRTSFLKAYTVSKVVSLTKYKTYAIDAHNDDVINYTRAGIIMPSGSVLNGNFSTLKVLPIIPNSGAAILCAECSNVEIKNINIIGSIDGRNPQSAAEIEESAEIGISIFGSNHIYISNVTMSKIAMDGIYIANHSTKLSSKIFIDNTDINNPTNSRNAVSIVAVDECYIDGCRFNNGGYYCCVDLEPNHEEETIRDVRLTGSVITQSGNSNKALYIDGSVDNSRVDCFVDNCYISGDIGFLLTETNSIAEFKNNIVKGSLILGTDNNRDNKGNIDINSCKIYGGIDIRNEGNINISNVELSDNTTILPIEIFNNSNQGHLIFNDVVINAALSGTYPIYFRTLTTYYNIEFRNILVKDSGGSVAAFPYLQNGVTIDTSCIYNNVVCELLPTADDYGNPIFNGRFGVTIIPVRTSHFYDKICASKIYKYSGLSYDSTVKTVSRGWTSDGEHYLINNDENRDITLTIENFDSYFINGIVSSSITLEKGKCAKVFVDTASSIAIIETY